MFTYGFYNAKNHDKVYDAVDFSELFNGIINDGVFMTVGECFKVEPVSGGIGVSVGSGRAWFDGTWSDNNSKMIIKLTNSDMLEARIDAIVISIDKSRRENKIEVIKGTKSSSPIRPTLNNTETKKYYPLAYVTIPANSNTLNSSNIQNVVGLTPTPFVTGILQTTNVDSLYRGWERKFNDWFALLQTTLDGDVAANLANEIFNLKEFVYPKGTETIILTNSGTFTYPSMFQSISIMCVGPGGDSSSSAGGGGGQISKKTITEAERKYEQITINNNVTSFGNICSAGKGQNASGAIGGSSSSMGGGGGGGLSSTHHNTPSIAAGGNGGTYGGGGGGAGAGATGSGSYYNWIPIISGTTTEYHYETGYEKGATNGCYISGCNGGGGGTYGGGGGAGGSVIQSMSGSETFNVNEYKYNIVQNPGVKGGAGGGGGVYGGNGGTSSRVIAEISNYGSSSSGVKKVTYTKLDPVEPQNGTDTSSFDLEFKGSGVSGTGGNGVYYTAMGGGGGYGGVGGDAESNQFSGGGGGGGYGGNGGDGRVPPNSIWGHGPGGGGGGYGGNGADGISYGGGGGGGYGKTQVKNQAGQGYGAGASGYQDGTSIPSGWINYGAQGCIIVEIIYSE